MERPTSGDAATLRAQNVSRPHNHQSFPMSDLQRKIFGRSKSATFGMEPVAENPAAQNSPSPSAPVAEPSREDADLVASFHRERDHFFTNQDTYSFGDASFQTYFMPPSTPGGTVLVCHHGAGSSAMTFYALAKCLVEECDTKESVGVFAFDARGHGNSSAPVPAEYSLDSLTQDFARILDEFAYRNGSHLMYLMGHSLGGAVLTNYILRHPSNGHSIRGLVVLDIVEETAIRALSSIPSFLNKRPKSFAHYADAIQWHFSLRLLLNEDSARVSVIDLLRRDLDGSLTWRADLGSMCEFWDSWFVNLSDNFIECGKGSEMKVAKLLILSGNENLDKELIIGQMQGKYQLIVFNNTATGHFVHEDVPKQTAITIMDFVRRNSPATITGKGSAIKTRWGGKINQ
ncbi:putative phosphatase methylesterase [Clavispora lusitaniae]|uniref:Phosphatase methylesterase n=1 Tax=Clavispora lusitaniae TaxID=36911 RepID=A0ACD0WKG9_CLALS|nr:putative phosphatase methylesterase [Clavispora lusitaniae]QFZ33716.1 putative phosphatase methylesterase [Clavispora lusitaniae]QFZ39387.1 putative phosphatase methylesterase [Clavispora lusitaniae]QFZ39400.1 putative phosphatase methylesterase [Clavispora lusitaniae]QFZ45069.1 putative phosphatase methylesterase [Clavispora lusitaniae]